MAFNFGAPSTNNAPAAPATGFSFGSTSTAPTAAGGGFSFGASTPAPATGGLSFGAPAPAAPAPSAGASAGFSFGGGTGTATGATDSKPAAALGGFSFGAGTTTTATATTTDSSASKPAAAAAGFSFGAASTPAPAAGDTKASAAVGGFSFGGTPAPKPAEESKAPATTTANDSKPAAATAGFSFGASASKPAAAAGFSFGAASTPAPATGDAKAPAAGGGFSFGGAAASKSSESTAAPPAPGGGFSFGGATAPKDASKDSASSSTPAPTTTTPAAKSGFSFGGVDTPAPKAPSPVKTPNDTAPTPGFASPSATTDKTSESTATKPEMIEPPPIEYQSLTVEQIINRFQSDLETDAIAFLQEAQRVAHYDATLRDTQHSLSELTNMVSRLMVHQSEVDTQLQGIGSYQRELATTLDQLEQNVDELFAAQSGISVQDADIERERAYERALEVDSKLGQMNNVLENVVNDLKAAQERVWSMSGRGQDGYGKDEEVGKIIGVFNSHNETLAQLDAKARALEADVTMVGQVLARTGH
eukprot:CCRYP_012806-RB/>CCRYP_012806-RB protein AED:0.06 eAED:0.06 QI:119/1/1/1/1/1/3/158/532